MSDQHNIHNLLDIMQSLRDPKTGCSWDQVQTFQTIAPYTIEEAYEVADAIARNDMSELCDELGDLLLQVVYHSQMAAEQGAFVFADVVQAISEKMIRRHPHVFGSDEEIKRGKQDWEKFKQKERHAKGIESDDSAIANVSSGLPSLLRARKLQKKAAKVNFDWDDVGPVINKLKEEIKEMELVIAEHQSQERLEDEIGDILFSVVNVCRHTKVDADIALQKANKKFEKRFRLMERLVEEQDEKIQALSQSQLDEYWNIAKQQLNK